MYDILEFSKDIIISDGRINLSQNVLMFVEYLIWFGWSSPGVPTPMHYTNVCISLIASCNFHWKFEAIIFDNHPLPNVQIERLG